mmetsp:Transcript_1210/g.3592  ORF Transcript_1210/g.3592 Transcript_1210/m.3592 type:complete len:149 (-) Transcript_1210:802-1248(-)
MNRDRASSKPGLDPRSLPARLSEGDVSGTCPRRVGRCSPSELEEMYPCPEERNAVKAAFDAALDTVLAAATASLPFSTRGIEPAIAQRDVTRREAAARERGEGAACQLEAEWASVCATLHEPARLEARLEAGAAEARHRFGRLPPCLV